MDLPQVMAGGLAVNRMAFGLKYLVRPESAGPSWIGRSANRPAAGAAAIRPQG